MNDVEQTYSTTTIFSSSLSAWAIVEVNMEDRVEVYRGTTAQITCIFTSDDGIGGMTIEWFYMTQQGKRQRIYNQDPTMNSVDLGGRRIIKKTVNSTGAPGGVVLTINEVRLEDEVEFICEIKSLTDGRGEGRTKLKVFAKPDRPTIEAVQGGISVKEERPSKIGVCEVKHGFPKPNITWYRNDTPLRSGQYAAKIESSTTTESSGLYSVKSELSLKVKKEDKDAEFYCEVNYFVPGETRMTETERITITVYYPSTAVNVWVESPKGKIKEGDSIELHCYGNGNDPSAELSITYPGGEDSLEANMFVLENVTRLNSGIYNCSSLDTDSFELIEGSTTVFVNYLGGRRIIKKDTIEVDMGKELQATCNALSSLQTHVAWFKDGKEVTRNHTLIRENVTFDTAGTYECVVTVSDIEGMNTSGTLQVNVNGRPEILTLDTEMEQSFEKSVELSCLARGFPAPSITWTTSDGKVLKTVSQEATEEGVKSVVSVKVTSDITAFCNASNEYGTDAVTFSIKAIKPETAIPPKKIKKEGSGVIIAVIIICILLLAILGSVLYFLYKKGKICGRSGKQDLTKEKSNKDNIVVEMKSDNTEEAILLGVNGEKQPPSDQVDT
ncbi:cell surface glycoprotein MUC18 [Lates japonicus]